MSGYVSRDGKWTVRPIRLNGRTYLRVAHLGAVLPDGTIAVQEYPGVNHPHRSRGGTKMRKLRMSAYWRWVAVAALMLTAWLVSVVRATGITRVSPEMMTAFARAVGW